jgi:hypothetical protein
MLEIGNTSKILVGNLERKNVLGRHGSRWDGKIKRYVKEIRGVYRLDSAGPGEELVTSSCEYETGFSGSIKYFYTKRLAIGFSRWSAPCS